MLLLAKDELHSHIGLSLLRAISITATLKMYSLDHVYTNVANKVIGLITSLSGEVELVQQAADFRAFQE